MDELLMDLQVFVQEFLREHLAMKFSWNLSHFLLREDKTFWPSKTLCIKFVPKSPIYRPLMAIHKSNEKM
ncbi:hypothetical protein GmHk_20G057307 [Glycine max]|nr:hypothetical protein GmHk_20G057307 [Glycine max]